MTKRIGFIGQGFIGRNYADDFDRRGYSTVRYALETPYRDNRDSIQECDIVFIAVPTPTTPEGFDDSALRAVLPLVGSGKIAVIKSTMPPGTTETLQETFPDIIVLHSPEFLTEANAAIDAAQPSRNIVGTSLDAPTHRAAAQAVLDVLPSASYERICSAREAELSKYAGNCLLYLKVVFANMLYDAAAELGASWDVVRENIAADPRIGSSHLQPVHKSGPTAALAGRGAGGHCFIKDFAAFRAFYESACDDEAGLDMLEAIERKNIDLLRSSGKDAALLAGVYGDTIKNI